MNSSLFSKFLILNRANIFSCTYWRPPKNRFLVMLSVKSRLLFWIQFVSKISQVGQAPLKWYVFRKTTHESSSRRGVEVQYSSSDTRLWIICIDSLPYTFFCRLVNLCRIRSPNLNRDLFFHYNIPNSCTTFPPLPSKVMGQSFSKW